METAPRQQNRYPRVSRARAASRAARPSGTAAAQLPQIADYRLQGAIEQLIVGQQADFAALVEAAQFQMPIFCDLHATAIDEDVLAAEADDRRQLAALRRDRKSTRLNSSHVRISY